MHEMFYNCNKLTTLDLSSWTVDSIQDIEHILRYNSSLNKVIVNDLNFANSIIPWLYNRTGTEAGTLVYYDIDSALLDTPTLQAKNWNLSYEPILAKYIFDSNVYDNLLPRGGSSMLCDIIDDVKSDGRIVRTVKYKNSSYIVKWIGFGVSSGGTDITAQESLLSVLYMDVNSNVDSLNNAFASCKNLKYINTRNWNTCNVTDMYCAFYLCNNLPYLNVSNFNTENVRRFDNTFMGCYNMVLEGYENLDTSNATTIEGMFGGCGRHTMKEFNLSNYDMSKVVDADKLFYGCTKVEAINLDNFILNNDTSKTTIFKECHELIRISSNNCSTETINNIISELPDRTGKEYGKIYIINHNEIELINRDVLEAKNWKAVIRGGNIKAVHIPNELFQSLGLGNVMVKHVHIGERFL
jgi:surface protein